MGSLCRRDNKPNEICLKVIATVLLSFVSVGFAGCSRSLRTDAEMQHEFFSEFGFVPDRDVSGYQCEVSSADISSTWFSFRCSQSSWEKIQRSERYEIKMPTDSYSAQIWEDDILSGDPSAPKWWPGLKKAGTIYWRQWHTEDRVGHCIYLWRDSSNEWVYAKSTDWR